MGEHMHVGTGGIPPKIPATPPPTGLGTVQERMVTLGKSDAPAPPPVQGDTSTKPLSERVVTPQQYPAPDRNALKTLVGEARAARNTATQQGHAMSPLEANILIGQMSNARRAIACIFGSQNLLGDMAGMDLAELETKIDRLPMGKLSPEDRELVGQLRDMIAENTRALNPRAEALSPTTTLFADDLVEQSNKEADSAQLKQIRESSREDLSGRMNALVPDTMKDSWYRRNLKGDEAKRQMNQLNWEFKQLLKSSPDVRVVLGGKLTFATEAEKDRFLDDFVGKLRLAPDDKARMKSMLSASIREVQPRPTGPDANLVVGKLIGEGGYGKVYEATLNGKPVVVKKMGTDVVDQVAGSMETKTVALVHEMTMQGRVHDDPNIPKIIGLYYDGNTPCLVSERVMGKGVNHLIDDARETVLRQPENRAKVALHVFDGAVRALDTMAKMGMVHRDIKPHNIMLDANTMEARLIDYGTAGIEGQLQLTESTKMFFPLERSSRATPAFDVYSMGCSLYWSMVGQQAMADGYPSLKDWNAGVLPGNFDDRSVWTEETVPLQHLITACWSKNPSDRPTTQQLVQAMNGEPIQPSGPDEPGLKADQLGALDVLRPDHPLRQGALELLKDAVRVPSPPKDPAPPPPAPPPSDPALDPLPQPTTEAPPPPSYPAPDPPVL